MQSYLSQPGCAVPLPVGLQVPTSIGCLVNQTQQLHPLWHMVKERIYTQMTQRNNSPSLNTAARSNLKDELEIIQD